MSEVITIGDPSASVPMESLVTEQRKREAWTEDDTKPLRRVAKVAEDHNINVMLQCRECKQLVEFDAGPGGLTLNCACTIREVI